LTVVEGRAERAAWAGGMEACPRSPACFKRPASRPSPNWLPPTWTGCGRSSGRPASRSRIPTPGPSRRVWRLPAGGTEFEVLQEELKGGRRV